MRNLKSKIYNSKFAIWNLPLISIKSFQFISLTNSVLCFCVRVYLYENHDINFYAAEVWYTLLERLGIPMTLERNRSY